MKKISLILASSTAAMLLAAAPFLASAHHTNVSTEASGNARVESHEGFGLDMAASLFHKEDGDQSGDKADNEGDENNDDTDVHAADTEKHADMSGVAGVITSVNGNVLTIMPFGTKATTTVTTNASTVVRVKGGATSTNALVAGANIVAIGTSTAAENISASFIGIFTHGFEFFKNLFR